MTRRAFFYSAFGVAVTATPVTAAGVHLTGRLDSTETEKTEHTANFGKACAIFVNDPALWAAIEPMLGSDVTLSIYQP